MHFLLNPARCKYLAHLRVAGQQGVRSDYEAMLIEQRREPGAAFLMPSCPCRDWNKPAETSFITVAAPHPEALLNIKRTQKGMDHANDGVGSGADLAAGRRERERSAVFQHALRGENREHECRASARRHQGHDPLYLRPRHHGRQVSLQRTVRTELAAIDGIG